uniref:Cas_Cas4 domain-containing protein n=1 Tax=Gongylonema pulchrum TaxID=637853 RepID=A0A183EIR5_9BILA
LLFKNIPAYRSSRSKLYVLRHVFTNRYFTVPLFYILRVVTEAGEEMLTPLELKTGKSNVNTEHAMQVMLYCLALTSKQDKIGSGLLFYLLDEVSRAVVPKSADLKGILHLRNEIAASMSSISFDSLPEPLVDTRGCSWCSHALSCSLLQCSSGSHVTDSFFKKQLEHLSPAHIEYFIKFARWTLVETEFFDEQLDSMSDGVMLLILSADSKIITTASVILAKGALNLRFFFLRKVAITLSVGLIPSLHFTGPNLDVVANCRSDAFVVGAVYQLKKHDSSSTFTINLGNLVMLMRDSKQMAKMRSLLIDMRAPSFSKMRKEDISIISEVVKQLNGDQARAVVKCLMAKDFAVIEGFPGSGKRLCSLNQRQFRKTA